MTASNVVFRGMLMSFSQNENTLKVYEIHDDSQYFAIILLTV